MLSVMGSGLDAGVEIIGKQSPLVMSMGFHELGRGMKSWHLSHLMKYCRMCAFMAFTIEIATL